MPIKGVEYIMIGDGTNIDLKKPSKKHIKSFTIRLPIIKVAISTKRKKQNNET